jgi:sulfiredoxin
LSRPAVGPSGGFDYVEPPFTTLMSQRHSILIAQTEVPKRRETLDASKVQALAGSILDQGLVSPILIREDCDRFALNEGLHRLEASRALGEESIAAYLVSTAKALKGERHETDRVEVACVSLRLWGAPDPSSWVGRRDRGD